VLSAFLPAWHPPWSAAAILRWAPAKEVASPVMAPPVMAPPVEASPTLPSAALAASGAGGAVRTLEGLSAPSAAHSMPWGSILLALWALGALVEICRLARALGRVSRVVRHGRPLDEPWSALLHEAKGLVGFGRRVRLLESAEVATPMTGGLIQPVVLLPPTSRDWTPERRRLVLLHELVHVQRGDWLVQIVARMACVLHWWNPLVWLASRRLEVERETACDEVVLDLGARPSEYATHLLAIAEDLHADPVPALAALAMAQPKQLEGRLMSILTPKSFRFRAWQAVSLLAGMACLVLLLATFEIEGEPVPQTPPPAEGASLGNEGAEHARHQEWTTGNWTMDTTRDDGLRFTVRVQGSVRTGETATKASNQVELDAGSVLEFETRLDGRTVRLEMVGGRGGETTETLWVDGIIRPLDAASRAYRQAAFAAWQEQQERGALRGQVGALRGQVGALRGREGALRGQIGALRGREGALRGQIGALRGRTGAMRGEIGALRGHAGAMKGHLGALRGELATLRAQGYRLEGEGREAARKAEMEARSSALEAEVREIEAQLADFDVESRVAGIEARIAEFDTEGQEREIQAQLAAMETEAAIAEIESQVEALATAAKVAEIEREIEALAVAERAAEIESRLDDRFRELRRTMEGLVP